MMLSKKLSLAGSVVAVLLAGSLVGGEAFYRGDCNFSRERGAAVDLADAAAVISYLFDGSYVPPCMDACDADDDGVINGTDAIFILKFLFQDGPWPPSPGAGIRAVDGGVERTDPGDDPTDDVLDCAPPAEI